MQPYNTSSHVCTTSSILLEGLYNNSSHRSDTQKSPNVLDQKIQLNTNKVFLARKCPY